MAGGKRLVRQVVQFKKTYSRYVCHYYILNFMCWGIEKKKLYVSGGNRKEDLCFGVKKRS